MSVYDQFDKPYNPTDDMSGFDTFRAGLGKSFADLGHGAQQLIADAGAKGLPVEFLGLPPMSPQDWAKTAAALRTQSDATKTQDKALMDTTGGTAGNISGQVLQSAMVPVGGAASGAGRLMMAALSGATQAGLQPVGTDDSRTSNAVQGAALGTAGQGVANLFGAIVRPAASSDPARQAAVDWAKANDVPLTAAQMSGNTFGARMEKILASLPGSKNFYAKTADSQRQAIDNTVNGLTANGNSGALLNQAGAGKVFTADAPFSQALSDLPSNFTMLAGGLKPTGAIKTAADYAGASAPSQFMIGNQVVTAQSNPKLFAALSAKAAPGGGLLPTGASIPMTGPRGDFNNYQAIRSQLSKQAFGAAEGTPDAAGYQALRDIFDDAAERSLSAQGTDPKVMDRLRAAYAADKLTQGAGTVLPSGEVTYSGSKLATAINKADNAGTLPKGSEQELRDLANFARQIQPVNSSGTAENTIAGKVATLEILKDALSGGGLGSAAAMLVGMVAGPFGVNSLMQGTRYGVPLLRDTSPAAAMTMRQIMSAVPASLPGIINAQ